MRCLTPSWADVLTGRGSRTRRKKKPRRLRHELASGEVFLWADLPCPPDARAREVRPSARVS